MELYIHRPGNERVELREVEATTTVVEAAAVQEGERVWLVEEDITEVDITVTLAEAKIPHRGHIHANRCHEVATSVTFNGETKGRTFHPATRIERVHEWAVGKEGFKLDPKDAAEHALQLCNTTDQPDDADHLGSFVNNHCAVCFDLVPKHRAEG